MGKIVHIKLNKKKFAFEILTNHLNKFFNDENKARECANYIMSAFWINRKRINISNNNSKTGTNN